LIVAVEEFGVDFDMLGAYQSRMHTSLIIDVCRKFIGPIYPLFTHYHLINLNKTEIILLNITETTFFNINVTTHLNKIGTTLC